MTVNPVPGYILGVDLHGTLLEPGEVLRPELAPAVAQGLRRLSGRALRYLCTGNDLEFVRRKIQPEILAEIDGYVLETGCSRSRDGREEEVATSGAERELIAELEAKLRAANFPQVNYFAHRLTTISMFCDDPRGFARTVEDFVRRTPHAAGAFVTWSSVAVDILPAGYNKHRGLTIAAGGRKTIGIADSMNDLALLAQSDYAAAPQNLAPELRPRLAEARRAIRPLASCPGLDPSALAVSPSAETRGVIEILAWLDRVLPDF